MILLIDHTAPDLERRSEQLILSGKVSRKNIVILYRFIAGQLLISPLKSLVKVGSKRRIGNDLRDAVIFDAGSSCPGSYRLWVQRHQCYQIGLAIAVDRYL